jgi:S-methylmethionine-dependent homocysteine/selenocysteine methylase/methylase of polypeptide subunit release factors
MTEAQPSIEGPGAAAAPAGRASSAFGRVAEMIGQERCVVLDGAMGTELPRVAGGGAAGAEERLWGTRALIDTPDLVLDVHRRYVAAGCDVISTDTWGLASALAGGPRLWDDAGAPLHWMDVARRGVRLAVQAAERRTEPGECAVAFSLNAAVDSPDGRETIRLLARLFADEPRPPDLILVETLSLLRPSLMETVEELLGVGLPVWLSFRRCRRGVCGVYGEHWGGPEGDEFGRAARRFEQMGVGALLINCIPPDHVPGMVSYLRDFSDLPLGVYPNLGYFTDAGWRVDPGVGGEEYARMALQWREEGAQIIGGCCGTSPEHIAVARERLTATPRGHRRRGGLDDVAWDGPPQPVPAPPAPWTDGRDRRLYPLPFPDIAVDPGVHQPTEASLMAWRYLFREGIGAHQRCLDVGCGTGILGVQLALNGAAHVRAIDVDRRAVANTLTNAFRNGVDDRLTATVVDLYPWTPEERYEVVVASLHQLPADPVDAVSTHRAVDYWGRNLLDQLMAKLSEALAPEGVAYLMHLSILSQQRTAELLDANGFRAEVADYALFGFPPELQAARRHVSRVEELSDANHVVVGDRDVMVAYLLEVTPKALVNGRRGLRGNGRIEPPPVPPPERR